MPSWLEEHDAGRRDGNAGNCYSIGTLPGLLGVHALGQRATEIIHIGQAVLSYGGSIEYFRDTVFNYPTLAEAYKVAGASTDSINFSVKAAKARCFFPRFSRQALEQRNLLFLILRERRIAHRFAFLPGTTAKRLL